MRYTDTEIIKAYREPIIEQDERSTSEEIYASKLTYRELTIDLIGAPEWIQVETFTEVLLDYQVDLKWDSRGLIGVFINPIKIHEFEVKYLDTRPNPDPKTGKDLGGELINQVIPSKVLTGIVPASVTNLPGNAVNCQWRLVLNYTTSNIVSFQSV